MLHNCYGTPLVNINAPNMCTDTRLLIGAHLTSPERGAGVCWTQGAQLVPGQLNGQRRRRRTQRQDKGGGRGTGACYGQQAVTSSYVGGIGKFSEWNGQRPRWAAGTHSSVWKTGVGSLDGKAVLVNSAKCHCRPGQWSLVSSSNIAKFHWRPDQFFKHIISKLTLGQQCNRMRFGIGQLETQ